MIKLFLSGTANVSLMLLHEDDRHANAIAMRDVLKSMGADLMPFPSQVNVQPAPAVAGEFANTNPRSTFLAGPGGLVAGVAGVTIGRFAWTEFNTVDADAAPATVSNNFPGIGGLTTAGTQVGGLMPQGLVHREQQGLITAYLAESGMVIPGGFAVTLMNGGDFFVKNDGTTEALPGQYAFANFADGRVTFAAALPTAVGTGSTNAVTMTGSIGPIATTSFTGSISGNILTVTAISTGALVVGGTLTGTGGGGVVTGTQIVSQLSGGTVGGVGTYAVNVEQ